MGACQSRNEADNSYRISRMEFDFIETIGKGALGRVSRVIHKSSCRQFAIKEYIKEDIPSSEALHSILNERSLLSIMESPFIVNMNFAFQDKRRLYLGLDLKLGGDLRFHMLKKKFPETEMKFIMGCLVHALEYVHSLHIIHKDLKPENVLFDSNGYAFLTDFGTAEILKPDNCTYTSGTPGYMAPEVICRQNHGLVSDFFALGVILYENIAGSRPYIGKSRKDIRDAILQKQVKIDLDKIPEGWTAEAADLCNKLLKRKPDFRIGFHGIQEIKNHPWFGSGFLDEIFNLEAKAPFTPVGTENYDQSHVNNPRRQYKSKLKTSSSDFISYFFRKSNS